MGVEGVGVEQVQRVVQHRVPDPRDLPGGADRVAEVGRDAAGHVQHQRPGREHRQRDARERHPRELARAPAGEGAQRAAAPAAAPGARPCARHPGRRRAAMPVACGRAGTPCSRRLFGLRGQHGLRQRRACALRRADAPAATLSQLRVKVLVVGAGGVGAAFAAIAQRRDAFERVVLADVSARARARGGRPPGRARPLRGRAGRRLRPRRARRADRAGRARRGAQRLRPALQRADLRRVPSTRA